MRPAHRVLNNAFNDSTDGSQEMATVGCTHTPRSSCAESRAKGRRHCTPLSAVARDEGRCDTDSVKLRGPPALSSFDTGAGDQGYGARIEVPTPAAFGHGSTAISIDPYLFSVAGVDRAEEPSAAEHRVMGRFISGPGVLDSDTQRGSQRLTAERRKYSRLEFGMSANC
jgi:hypothetical protein